MLPPYLKIWEWEWIFGRAVKAISFLGVRSPCLAQSRRKVWGKGQIVRAYSAPLIGIQLIVLPKSGGGAKLPPCSSDPIAQWGINLILMNKDISTVLFCNFNWFLFSFFVCLCSFLHLILQIPIEYQSWVLSFNFFLFYCMPYSWTNTIILSENVFCVCWSFKNANAKEQSCDFRWHL